MSSYAANNNSISNPNFVLKVTLVTFLCLQAIRQLINVNNQFTNKKETRSGQVAAWITIVMTLAAAVLLFPSEPLSRKATLGGLLLLFVGAMSSGIAMIYASLKTDDGVKDITEPTDVRRWFGVGHVFFAIFLFAFLLYSLTV